MKKILITFALIVSLFSFLKADQVTSSTTEQPVTVRLTFVWAHTGEIFFKDGKVTTPSVEPPLPSPPAE